MTKRIIEYMEIYINQELKKGIGKGKALENIGLKKTAMAMYEKGSVPNDEPLVKMAIKLKKNPIELLTLAAAERAKNRETQRIWLRFHDEILKNRPIAEKIKEEYSELN